ncbi:DUF1015 domain-containing protein [Streptomyces sp. NBC_01803]|uniref:DUF1015 domain-containing protein n=1 Tax=Streptomyces sp. NBC_01803 TaxID=2975946 RepID=UPI002DDB4EF0|nr:DUF1015 domain-containing protein [Streptomyces sp. NBC_01803]WSA46875.1 DUF1015 domain-containing protein [Streptomyces sp. NBC_01803]
MRHDGLDLAPFRALRYVPDRVGSLAAVTSPPYDMVVRPDGVDRLETADPHNIVRLILPHDGDPAARHRRAGDTLRRWRADGVLALDPWPAALYVYEQRAAGTLQRGLIGALRLTRPEDGVVLPHEDVIAEVVADRAALMRATAANLEPLLLSYRDGAGAAAVVERAVSRTPLSATTTADGTEHRLWPVTDPAELDAAIEDLARHRALIADGHHRWATYLRLADEHGGRPPWDRGLVLLVDTARYPLRVQPIHRLLSGLPPAEALARLNGAFRTRRLGDSLADALHTLAGTEGNAFLLTDGDTFHLLDRPDAALLAATIPQHRPAKWRELDATVLHAALLGPVWGVVDGPAAVRYLHDATAVVAQAHRLGGTAVLMRPVPESTVRALAEEGVTMPHKSTSFGPKPATGLLLRSLDTGFGPN